VKTCKLGDYLTDAQIERCIALYPSTDAIRREVIEPNMTEINRKLGQENDAQYLAYMVTYAIEQAGRELLEQRVN
jgi:hypothetical protein